MSESRRSQKVRLEDVRKLEEQFDVLPEQTNVAIQRTDAIRILLPKIQILQSRGYSLTDIAERLTQGGVPIKASVLATYLRREVGAKRKSKPRKRIQENTAEQEAPKPEGSNVEPANTATQPRDEPEPPTMSEATTFAPPEPEQKTRGEQPRTAGETPAALAATPPITVVNEPKGEETTEKPKRQSAFKPRKDTPL